MNGAQLATEMTPQWTLENGPEEEEQCFLMETDSEYHKRRNIKYGHDKRIPFTINSFGQLCQSERKKILFCLFFWKVFVANLQFHQEEYCDFNKN